MRDIERGEAQKAFITTCLGRAEDMLSDMSQGAQRGRCRNRGDMGRYSDRDRDRASGRVQTKQDEAQQADR